MEAVLAELPAEGAGAPEPLRHLAHYLQATEPAWTTRPLAGGLPIGSGVVESGCKHLVHARHRQAGMRWGKAHVQKMLDLVAALRSHRWEAFWATKPAVA